MKTTSLLVLLLSVTVLAFADDPPIPGLVSATGAESASLDDLVRKLAAAKDLPVPEPAKTPYDADPDARKAYLESYRTGYRRVSAGVFSTCCISADTPHGDAVICGHYDGERAAERDRLVKQLHTPTSQ